MRTYNTMVINGMRRRAVQHMDIRMVVRNVIKFCVGFGCTIGVIFLLLAIVDSVGR